MAHLRVLSSRGDSAVEWDIQRADAGDAEAIAAVDEAERIFRQQRARGATAFIVEGDQPARRIDTFDPHAEQILMVPRLAGGR